MLLCLEQKPTPSEWIIYLCLNLILNLVFRVKRKSQKMNKQHILKIKSEIIQSIRKYFLWLKFQKRLKITLKEMLELKLNKGETWMLSI